MNPITAKPAYKSAETYGLAAGQALATAAAMGQLPNSTPTLQLIGLLVAGVLPIVFGWLRTSLKGKAMSADESSNESLADAIASAPIMQPKP